MNQIKFTSFKEFLFVSVVLCITGLISPLQASEFHYTGPELKLDYSGTVIVDNSHFKYTASDRLTFSTKDYLKHNSPKLLPVTEAIDTWAALHSIHPRVLSDLLNDYFEENSIQNSIENKQKIFEITTGLSQIYNKNKDSRLAASKAVRAVSVAYDFDLKLNTNYQAKRIFLEHDYFRGNAGPPLYSYLQPPWPRGEMWAGGGVHSNSGGGDSPRNSLDFWKIYVDWGGDTSQTWVNASQLGIARVFSSCSMQVIHPNGWVTSYYHLDNIQVNNLDDVEDSQRLSNYADNLDQAICQGGSSSGPHVHFSLFYAGDAIEIDEPNVDFSSWKHQAGIGQYDGDCDNSIYTITPGNETVCPYYRSLPNNTRENTIFIDGFGG